MARIPSSRVSLLRGAGRRREEASDERGETLIEILATVVLLGTAIVGLVTLLLSVVVSAHTHRRAVRSANESVNVAEYVESMVYTPCADASTYQPALDAVMTATLTGAGYTAEIKDVRYLTAASVDTSGNPSTLIPNITSVPSGASFQDTCPSPENGVQEISIEVRNARGKPNVREVLVVHKRLDTCPVSSTPAPTSTTVALRC